MHKMRLLTAFSCFFMSLMGFAQTNIVSERILPSKEEGAWPCRYYLPNTNADLTAAVRGKWYDLGEDESDWAEGFGPFSSESDAFLVTPWGSSVRPLLVRRHFTLSEEALAGMKKVVFRLSYDENPRVYLNGTTIMTATGWNDSNYAEVTLTAAQRRKLQAGDNVLAISLQQGGGSGHVDCSLDITYDPTGIESPLAPTDEADAEVYNLSGQRISQAQHGVNIVGGRKVLKH